MDYQTVRIAEVTDGKEQLREFLSRLETGQSAFRYFQNRPIDIVDSHITTLLLRTSEGAIAYGHLEEEGGRLWLGIAVADSAVGKGWGKVMMRELLAEAERNAVDRISLRVDIENRAGIGLYKAMGFNVIESQSNGESLLMEKLVGSSNAK